MPSTEEDTQLLQNVFKRLELMEIEGKFEISRQGIMLPPEQRPRNDKTFSYNITQIEGIEEYKDLHTLTKYLYCLPFELNMHAPWLQLQLTEHFEVAYYNDSAHTWHRMHMDSGYSTASTSAEN